MTPRIDYVTLEIVSYDDIDGHRLTRIPVPLPDDPFIAVVRQKWDEYADRLIAEAKAAPDTGFLPS